MRLLNFVFILWVGILSSTAKTQTIETSLQANEFQNGVDLLLQNHSNEDFICGEIKTTINFCNSAFCEFSQERQLIEQNIYIRAIAFQKKKPG